MMYQTSPPDLCYGASPSFNRYLPASSNHWGTAERLERCQHSTGLQEGRPSRC
ncbi:hypothetical protein DPMN_170976 [Dreissena polymorpha]|uniref:Uncharacterized protein n=1 Tax=Dreissena polymorpha TaxID=45954 RepID=A0A9D4IER4_DREPO|nr:hypothetical protein DPMN_170976 [Dreissena polymorpha]